MEKESRLSSSLEDYLETIHAIIRKKGAARPTDIARARNVAASSVTTALKNLSRMGLVNHEPYDLVTLTPEGSRIARKVTEKHDVLRDFFVSVLEIDRETAEECACGIEHVIPENVLERLTAYLEFVRKCESSGRRWNGDEGFICRCIDRDED
jgi:DtxR family Mn-dependent transcriptional regulator